MTRSHFGSVEYLGTDYYRVWWTDKAGKRRSKRIHGPRSEAEAYLAARNLDGMPSETTWGAFWRAKVAPQVATLAVNTQDEYNATWRAIEPLIGPERVCDMDWHRANEVVTSFSAPSMQRKVGKLLKKMCNMAVRDKGRLLQANPVQAMEYKPMRRRPKRLVDVTEAKAYMRAVEGWKHEGVMLALMGFGMRPEEAEALLWEDLRPYEFKGAVYCTARIDKALTWTHSQGKLLKDTKNESSARTAVCGEPWASRLLALADGRSGPLSPSGEDGDAPEARYTSPQTISKKWLARCDSMGVPRVAVKDMRSSYSTMMGEALVPDSIVAGNMGHSDGTVKGAHYQRVTMRAKCMAADMLAELVDEVSR